MRVPPPSGGARHRLRLRLALGLTFVAAAAGSARAVAIEPLAPSSALAKTTSTQGAPGPRPDAQPASEAQQRARRLFREAETHFQAGLFAEALGEYQAGYDAAALPGFLINIAQCERRLGNLTGALTTYRKFIMVAPDSPYVPQVQALLADLEKLVSDAERERDRERGASSRPGTRASAPALAAKPPTQAQAAALIDGVAPTPGAPAETEQAARASSARWWWIGGAAALVAIAGGTAAVFALRSGDATTLHEGSLGSVRR